MVLEAIRYNGGKLSIIDQLQLPFVEHYFDITTSEGGWQAIKRMQVRGAPAIAIVAALSLAAELQALATHNKLPSSAEDVGAYIIEKLDYLVSSRPTAVNLSDAARKLKTIVSAASQRNGSTALEVANAYIHAAEAMQAKDLEDNMNIGKHGAEWILANALSPAQNKATVLTHCNTGSLATSGYGTALGVVRSLKSNDTLRYAYCTETRPYNQGSRLTAFELVHDNIPATLITDSMAAALLSKAGENAVNAIIVGADRVAANGDTANKIGTYGLAVLARYHGVKFLVAAPLTTIDLATESGNSIVIEERPSSEVTTIKGSQEDNVTGDTKLGTVRIAAEGINVWNPAFDVTPSILIDGIVTEKGVAEKGKDGRFHLDELFD
ncbi:Methylthioribose-1-phosphate isomerase [Aspergillus karnatakaensis]|uniref:S-methyl-5-thioribose-1-phosphate isomerase n=1 Tax=Aspergillus karnatakaensis TaxID=1810916 RepID=UPI003CCC9C48